MNRLFFRSILIIFISFSVASCGALEATDFTGSKDSVSTKEEVLLFTGTDVTFSSSQLYRLDFDSQAWERSEMSQPLLSGSGDMVLFASQGRLFLFNRRSDDLNFRQITTESTGEGYRWNMGPQLATPSALAGDPHDVLVLDEEVMMLANFVSGTLAIVNYKTGDLLQSLALSQSTLKGEAFRPESLALLDDNRVAVLHQGYNENYKLNNTQALFLLEKAGQQNWRLASERNTVKLQTSIPQGLFRDGKNTLLTVGICPAGLESCQAGIEEINLQAHESARLMKVDNNELTYYGPPRQMGKSKFVMSAKHHVDGQSRAQLTSLDVKSGQTERLYKFPNRATSGYWGYTVSEDERAIFFGDAAKSGKGSLSVLDIEAKRVIHEFETDLVPYSLLLISPADIID